jgi:NAD(P)-dependent dehydrogenase (short-subunit alcohol dehydrogenase family)
MKNILLIGGSHGIGLELATNLSQGNYNVIVASRTNEHLTGLNVKHIVFDASTDVLDLSILPETIDGFVYCPGSINLKPFKNLKITHFQDDMDINFLHMVKVFQAVLPKLLQSPQAAVVLFSSVAASTGMPFHSSIAAAKAAVEGFGKAIAAEYAPKIRVNTIAPSITNTPLSEKFLNSDAKMERSAERHPLKKVGEPKDIAQMAQFLLSDQSTWITGQVFHVDGGMSTLTI